MGTTIQIEQFPLASFLLCMQASKATGGMLIKGQPGIATINFHLGEVVYVGLEGAKVRLGERMVDEHFLSPEQLRTILLLQQRTKPWKPLGLLCVENNLLNLVTLKIVVHRQMVSLLSEILSWQKGMFKFEQGEVATSDPISLSFFDYLNYQQQQNPPQWQWHKESPADFYSQLDQEEQRLKDCFSRWQEEFFKDEPELFSGYIHGLAIAQTLRNHRSLSAEIFTKELTRLFSNRGMSYEVFVKSGKDFNPLILTNHQSVHMESNHFEQGKVGGITPHSDWSIGIVPLVCGGKNFFALGIANPPDKVIANDKIENFLAELRLIMSSLNMGWQ